MPPRFSFALVVLVLLAGGLFLGLGGDPTTPPPVASATPIAVPKPVAAATRPARQQFLILAASWQPAFCEGAPRRQECRTQTSDRADASRFSLHGLWPRDEFCDLPAGLEQQARDGRWNDLPALELSPATARRLDEVMPGRQSQLDRYQWVKHGSCYGTDAESFYATAIALMDALNRSAVRDLFVASLGKSLTTQQIRAAFDQSFGAGAGQRVKVACETDGRRTLISEITLGLFGAPGPDPDLGALLLKANGTSPGCTGGVVDPAGLQ